MNGRGRKNERKRKSMRLPKQIKLGEYTYDLYVTDKIPRKYTKGIDTTQYTVEGAIGYIDEKIYLSSSLKNTILEVILWHEIVHGIIKQCDIDSDVLSETDITRIARTLVQVMKDNKDIIPVPR